MSFFVLAHPVHTSKQDTVSVLLCLILQGIMIFSFY